MNITKYSFFLFTITALLLPAFAAPAFQEKPVTDLAFSPDGTKFIFSNQDHRGLYIHFLETAETILLSHELGTAYGANWSRDSRYVAFKQLTRTADGLFLQAPVLFDVTSNRLLELRAAVAFCGIPDISESGKIAFTVGDTLFITNFTGDVLKSFALPAYANRIAFSPNSGHVVYNDANDQLWLLNIERETRLKLTDDERGYFHPLWSPRGDRFVFSSLDGKLFLYDVENREQMEIGPGWNPAWSVDGKWLFFSRQEVVESRELINSDLYVADEKAQHIQKLTKTEQWEDYPSVAGTKLIYSDLKNARLNIRTVSSERDKIELGGQQALEIDSANIKSLVPKSNPRAYQRMPVEGEYFNIPYVHQKYDMPSWFNGNWACGGTAAVMCLAYYGILKQWPSGNSAYGRYVCEIYSYNGYTYNIAGLDPNGVKGYGAYGFIIQDNWRDTKGYMAKYARQHGLASGVDWNPSRSKLIHEVQAKMPFVLLTSLTSAGHYISVIGYDNNGTTVIVNDPWGDKNRGYPNVYGRRARYDWPGYSNGNSSLVKLWCYIYFRGNQPDLLAETSALADTITIKQQIEFSGKIINRGFSATDSAIARILFSDNSRFDNNDILLKQFSIPSIAAKDTFAFSFALTVPDSLLSGIYGIGVLVDADSQMVELNESNNVAYERVVVRGYPKVYGLKPADNAVISGRQPTIFAYFADRYAKMDTSTVQLYLDSLDVTTRAHKSWNSISYVPTQPLAPGVHNVLLKAGNKAGFLAEQAWSFEIQSATLVEKSPDMPDKFRLLQNYPNPFNGATKIVFTLPKKTDVTLSVYTLTGALVKTLANGPLPAGQHVLLWDGTDRYHERVASGVYVYALETETFSAFKRLVYLK